MATRKYQVPATWTLLEAGANGYVTITGYSDTFAYTVAGSLPGAGTAGTTLAKGIESATFQNPTGSNLYARHAGNSGTLTDNVAVTDQATPSGLLSPTQTLVVDYTVATLPSAATNKGARAVVSDGNAPALGATVAGGGAVRTEVWSDGTNWKVI